MESLRAGSSNIGFCIRRANTSTDFFETAIRGTVGHSSHLFSLSAVNVWDTRVGLRISLGED
jgi:hypothetical protein